MQIRVPLLVCVFVAVALPAFAHPVSISEAEVDIHPERVHVVIRVMLEDLFRYHELEVDDDLRVARDDLEGAAAKHKDNVLSAFRIQFNDDAWLTPEFVRMTPPEWPQESVHVTDLMAAAYTYELNYLMPEPPNFLTLLQAFGRPDDILPAITHVTLSRQGQKMGHAYSLYKDIPSTIRMDWDATPLAADATDEEIRAWLEQEREATLGIATYGAAYSFLYIERREVRHEILIPLISLGTFIEILRKDRDVVDVEEQDTLRPQIEALLADHSTVSIDGIDATPHVDRIDFYGVDFRDFAQQAPERTLSIYTARVGIILRYPADEPPTEVKVVWDMFNEYIPVVFTNVYAFHDVDQFVFERYGADFTWSGSPPDTHPQIEAVPAPPAPLRMGVPIYALIVLVAGVAFLAVARTVRRAYRAVVALLTVALAALLWPLQPMTTTNPFTAPPAISHEEATNVFQTLLQNIYRAFDYRDEAEIYDALALSVHGELLRSLFLQIYEGLRMQEQGGAIARVEAVREMSGDAVSIVQHPSHAFDYRATWQVEGTVEHWGHIHARTNQYVAGFRIEDIEGAWKIVDMEVLDQSRVKCETGLRRPGR